MLKISHWEKKSSTIVKGKISGPTQTTASSLTNSNPRVASCDPDHWIHSLPSWPWQWSHTGCMFGLHPDIQIMSMQHAYLAPSTFKSIIIWSTIKDEKTNRISCSFIFSCSGAVDWVQPDMTSWRCCTLQQDHPPASWESLNPSAWQNGTTSGCHGMHTVLHGKWSNGARWRPKTYICYMQNMCYSVLGRSDSELVSVVSVLRLAKQIFCLRISFGVSIRYCPACRCDSLRLDTLTCQTQLVSLSCLSTQKTQPGALYRVLPSQSWDRLCKVERIIQEGATTCNTQSLRVVVYWHWLISHT